MDRSVVAGKLRRIVRRFDRDERGAVVLFSLAAFLILMLMAWLVMDAGQMTRDRLEAQASADVAAYSQAAVKARSMNMMAYTNIAKRSVVGVHSLYQSMYIAYGLWITEKWAACSAGDEAACTEAVENSAMYLQETASDYQSFRNNARNLHGADVRALDNYQYYLYGLSPWWGWTEAVVRAQRNSATLASSFPPPPGAPRGSLNDPTNSVIRQVGAHAGHNFTSFIDTLPVQRGDYWVDMLEGGMKHSAYQLEHALNTQHHRDRSTKGAALARNILAGSTVFFPVGFRHAVDAFGDHGRPWRIEHLHNEGHWLARSSNIVFTFREGDELFGDRRAKFSVPQRDYVLAGGREAEAKYRPQGYWSMARSEISYQNDSEPDLWHAAWIGRLRPIALPTEFDEAGYDLNAAYHDSIAFLSLSLLVGAQGIDSINRFFVDLVVMERATRAMGQSTAEGLGK